MKSLWHKILLLGMIVAGLGSCLYIIKERKKEKEILSEYRKNKDKPLTEQIPKIIYTDKDSITHIQQEIVKSLELSNTITKDYNTYVKDTLAVALDIAVDKIEELTRIKAQLEGELKATKIELDENKSKRIFYENKYLSIVSHMDSLGNPQNLKYTYNAELNIAQFSKRKHFFAPKKSYVDISSPDPNFKINGIEVYRKEIYQPPRNIGLGLQLGYGIDKDWKPSPYFGVGISYNLIKL